MMLHYKVLGRGEARFVGTLPLTWERDTRKILMPSFDELLQEVSLAHETSGRSPVAASRQTCLMTLYRL